MSYVRIFIGSIVLFFCSCSNQHPTVPDNVYGPTIDIRKEASNPFKSHFIRLMQAVRLTCGTYAEPYLYGYSGGGVGK